MFRGSRHEYTVAVAECLTKAGWDAQVSPMTEDGGTSLIFDVPEEQNDELDRALTDCYAEVGRLDQGLSDPTVLREWYEFQLDRSECLEAAGWDVVPAPSFETLADQMATDGYLSWSAADGVTNGDEARAQQACPDSTDF